MIPNKSNFKFQELTPITGVKPYVIRFWETEFPEISPVTSDGGQKLYSRKDVEAILKIKKLLFDEKLTIPEAKLQLHTDTESMVEVKPKVDVREKIETALKMVQEIKLRRKW